MIKVIKENIRDKRVFVVSDIHGNLTVFKQILSIVDLDKDYLFILGDLTSKGAESLAMLEFIMELSKHPHVRIIMGNCDRADVRSLNLDHLNWFKDIIHQNYLVRDLANIHFNGNIPYLTDQEAIALQQTFKVKYQKYFDFLTNLDHVIVTEDFIFTHSGIDKLNFSTDDVEKYVRNYNFYTDGNYSGKWVVFGHMPASIYKRGMLNNNILIDEEKKMILIDGAMNVAAGGQINLLEIDKGNIKTYSFDDYLELEVINDQVTPTYMKGPFWPDFNIEVIEIGQFFSICLNKKTKEISIIHNDLIIGNQISEDCPGLLINVRSNDKVKLIEKHPGYSLVKFNGTLGWLNNELINWSKYEN